MRILLDECVDQRLRLLFVGHDGQTLRYQDRWAVFAVDGAVARRRAIELGHRTALAAEITGGLKQGEFVVSHPDETVADGKLVAIGR